MPPRDLAQGREEEDAEDRRDPDGRERRTCRALGVEGEEEDEKGHDDDASSDPEQGAQEASGETDRAEHHDRMNARPRRRHGPYRMRPMAVDALLAPLREAPRRSALVFDVDGTLAPIVARPELAAIPEETRAELRRLAASYLLVACVSGRAGDDARRLVGVESVSYVGNHGLELHPDAHELGARIADFRVAIGLPVEDKGLSLTYHYREAADEAAARARLEEVAERARAEGLDPRWGRKALEIRPAVAADKGTALQALLGRSEATQGLYAGDDTTDLDAFAGLVAAGLEHTVRIAVASEEGPRELLEAADLVVEGPGELATLLRLL